MSKMKAVVLYGGRSTEHEVSCRSASYIFRNIDRNRFDAFAVGIDKEGQWQPQDRLALLKDCPTTMPIAKNASDAESRKLVQDIFRTDSAKNDIVIFNIIHGTTGEDGMLQGFFDLQGIAYVGPSLLGAAAAMDKVVAKQLAELAGVPVVPSVAIRASEWEANTQHYLDLAQSRLQFPIFVKPASLGSSVGIRKVKDATELKAAIFYAFEFDERILLETGMEVREIEFACLGGYDPDVSTAGEVGVAEGFYSYEEKYSSSSKADVLIPAPLDERLVKEGQDLAKKVFKALNLYGLARIDLFLTKKDNRFYFNEANTLPGFTSISQYPKLWEHAGMSGQNLVSRLLDLAIDRRRQQDRLKRSI